MIAVGPLPRQRADAPKRHCFYCGELLVAGHKWQRCPSWLAGEAPSDSAAAKASRAKYDMELVVQKFGETDKVDIREVRNRDAKVAAAGGVKPDDV